MPTLETADGTPVDVTPPADADQRFRQVMNDDGPDDHAPPPRQPSPPAEDKPRRGPGRPKKEDKARADVKTPAPVKDDYTADAQQLVGGVWTVAASISLTQPYALILDSNADQLVAALAEGAKHNTAIRGWLSAGENTWMVQLASVGITMGMQGMQLAKDKNLRAEAALITKHKLKQALKAQGIDIPAEAETPAAA